MIVKILCPKCQSSGTMILRDERFEGPYRCWKCQALFMVVLAGGKAESCTPLSQEDFEQWQAAASLRAKMGKK